MTNPSDERVRELEEEVTRLKAEVARAEERYRQEHQLFLAHFVSGLPQTDEEMQRYLADSVPFEDAIRELEAEYGPFPTGEHS